MTPDVDPPVLSLRERKTRRLRAQLVDSAVRLYLKVGYERATVDLIAADAGVAPRTFNRYFASKDEVFLAVLDPITDHLIAAIREQLDHLGPLEALRAAYVTVLTRIADRPFGRPSADQVAVMLRVVNSSNALTTRAVAHRKHRMRTILTARSGTPLDDQTVELVATVCDAVLVHAFGSLVAATDAELLGPRSMVQRMEEAFADLAELVADLDVSQSASDRRG